jgi:hypothetical protein
MYLIDTNRFAVKFPRKRNLKIKTEPGRSDPRHPVSVNVCVVDDC